MGYQTYLRRHLEAIANLLCGVAFYALLYLWSVILMKIQPSYGIYALRGVVFIGILVTIISCVYNLLLFNSANGAPAIKALGKFTFDITVPIQILMALLFVIFGMFFVVNDHFSD